MRRNKSVGSLGFTIVELLIAATITSLIVVMLGTMFGSLSKTSSQASQRIDTFRDARAALYMIERDISNLVLAKGTAYFASDYDLSNSSGSQARHLCALVSRQNKPSSSSSTPGDVCGVAYYCSWNGNAYQLHRYFRDSVSTFNLFSFKADGSLNYIGADQLYQLGTNDETVAANCWNLLITLYDSSGAIMSATSGGTISTPTGTTSTQYLCDASATSVCDRDPTTGNPKLPVAMEISFKAMSAEAARTATAMGVGANVWMAYDQTNGVSSSDKQTYDRLIGPHTYQFRTRIKLR